MRNAAEHEEETDEHGAQPGAEPRVVVARAFPLGEAVLEEVVVALAGRAAEDVGDGVEAGGALMRLLDLGGDLALRRALGDMDAGFRGLGSALVPGGVGDEGALDFVRVEEPRFLAVGLVDVVQVRIGLNPQEVCMFSPQSMGGQGTRGIKGNAVP